MRAGSYHDGEYSRCGDLAGEHILLKRNKDPFDDEPAEAKFSEFPILVYINDTAHQEQFATRMRDVLTSFALLRSERL
jgi:hypothetical protein